MGGTVKIPGIEHDFGVSDGTKYIVPPLTLGALELLQGRLANLATDAPTSPESIRTVIDATHLALQRNYPKITREEVAGMIDLSNMGEILSTVMDVAGLKRKELEAQGKRQPTGTQETPSASGT